MTPPDTRSWLAARPGARSPRRAWGVPPRPGPPRPGPARTVTAVAVATVLTAATAGCVGGDDGPGASGDRGGTTVAGAADLPGDLLDQEPDWSSCDEPDARQGADARIPREAADGVPWECASVTVPLDYAEADGDTLDLAVIRAESTGDADERIGSLVFNFGGPGGSGVITLPSFAGDYRTLHDRYDLVSFDPRGVGASDGLVCLDDEELDEHFAADMVPEDPEEPSDLTARTASFADACDERAGDLLPHLTTANTARDLDVLRHVLGDSRLHYFGVSYGTELGGVYAHHFPDHLGRAVLDAVVDPEQTDAGTALGQARGFEAALDTYLADCVEQDACPLGDSPEEGGTRLEQLLTDLRDDPLPTRDPDDRPLTASLAWAGIAQSLYSPDFWPYLTQGLDDATAAEDPDGTVLLSLGDAMNGRSGDGRYSSLQSSLTAIRCADSSNRYTVDDVRELLPDFHAASPVFGEALAWSLLGCTDWPVDGEQPHPEVSAPDAEEIVLIGTTGDPATPYEGTARMREALGEDTGVEITYEGEGHGAYTSGDPCVTEATDRYLLEGMVPATGLTCG